MKNDVRQLRLDRNLTQQQLSEALSVSRQTVNAIETDRYTPSLPLAIAWWKREGSPAATSP